MRNVKHLLNVSNALGHLHQFGHSHPVKAWALCTTAVLVTAWSFPDVLSVDAALWCIGGIAVGSWLSHRAHLRGGSALGTGNMGALLAQDISTSQQAFYVLQQQVGTTIQTSEAAVYTMLERVNRIHRVSNDMRLRVAQAVENSSRLSAASQAQAVDQKVTLQKLAAHQRHFESIRDESLGRVKDVAEQVRGLMPTAHDITEIARKIQIISLNAAIESAHAGEFGTGFKVVAGEVRRLSAETTAAAKLVQEGIHVAASSIDAEYHRLQQALDGESATQLDAIASHIDNMGNTLSDLVPYLSEFSVAMEADVQKVTEDILETLSQMQFQDINRQLLEQINRALGSLSDHFSQLYLLIDGKAPPPPQLLEELLQRWTDDYVMHAQRVNHNLAITPKGDAVPALSADTNGNHGLEASPAPQLAVAQGARIELF